MSDDSEEIKMKKLLIGLTLLLSLPAMASSYLCFGLDEGMETISTNSSEQLIGHLDGREVVIVENKSTGNVTVAIGSESARLIFTTKNDSFSFAQIEGEKESSLTCSK